MKTYNTFNEMFSDNSNTNKNLSVFNVSLQEVKNHIVENIYNKTSDDLTSLEESLGYYDEEIDPDDYLLHPENYAKSEPIAEWYVDEAIDKSFIEFFGDKDEIKDAILPGQFFSQKEAAQYFYNVCYKWNNTTQNIELLKDMGVDVASKYSESWDTPKDGYITEKTCRTLYDFFCYKYPHAIKNEVFCKCNKRFYIDEK